jgi:hypothetical protein
MESVQDKIQKVYELVNRGATEGEKIAAQRALDRLMRKYNLDESYLKSIGLKKYSFSYQTNLDLELFAQLMHFFFKDKGHQLYKSNLGGKRIVVKLEYLDYIQIDCAYGYFKPHMKKQFELHCLPLIRRCRTTKTKNAKRKQLQDLFFRKYVILSNIYHPDEVEEINLSSLSESERKLRMQMRDVQGGNFSQQMTTGLYLES